MFYGMHIFWVWNGSATLLWVPRRVRSQWLSLPVVRMRVGFVSTHIIMYVPKPFVGREACCC